MTKKLTSSLAVFTILGGIFVPQIALATPTIYGGMNIEITSPKATDTVKEGDTVRITWSGSATITEVSLYYFPCEGCLETIATHIPNTGSYDWKVKVGNPYGKTKLSIMVVGFGPEGNTVTDESDGLLAYQPPTNATPRPTPTEDFAAYTHFLELGFFTPEFDAFQITLNPSVMDTWPKAWANKQVEIEQGKPIMIALPAASKIPDGTNFSTVFDTNSPYINCLGTSKKADIENFVMLCETVGVGKTTIAMFQPASDGTFQLSKEIVVNITKASPTPTPSASASPTPTKNPTPSPKPSKTFSDLSDSHPLGTAIKKLRDQGVIGGYPDGSFKPEAPINRGEYTKIIIGALTDDVGNGKNCFNDVHEEWFAKYVCYAKEHGIIGGYPDGSFHPERNINYVEAVKIAMLAFGRMEVGDSEGTHWYDKYLNAAKARGHLELIVILSSGDPTTPTTRAQTAQLIVNVME